MESNQMDKIHDVAVIVGKPAEGSINRKVAHALAEVAPQGAETQHCRDRAVADLQSGRRRESAGGWTAFRERISAADAVLFVTPEHNRSVPAALKNALDVGSRPYGKSAWKQQAGRGRQRLAGRDRRVRRQPPPAAVAGVSECSSDGAAGGLSRPRRQAVRRKWEARQRRDPQILQELHERV